MSGPFHGKRILLGVSGSIAAYKAADLASKLTQGGAEVDVLMTHSATRFVTPLTFRSITHRPVLTDLFDPGSPEAIEHVALAQAAHVLVVAPATAHMLAKLALGLADDPISVTALATGAPVLVAPAMDANMWEHPAVRRNVETLIERGAVIVGPGEGRLASGLTGWGRLAETPELLGRIAKTLGANGDLSGRSIVVSAGGTQEPLDPVRVLTNRSSGKMGYAIAEAARDRGADVTLVTASAAVEPPVGVHVERADTAEQMRNAVQEAVCSADALVMAAAVADYRPADPSGEKLKKEAMADLSVALERTDDIIAGVPDGIVKVAFAAESRDLLKNARAKLKGKGVHLVAANDITLPGAGFGADENKVWLVDEGGDTELPLMAKYDVAMAILDRVVALLGTGRPKGR
ncbi:MAG: bifunctional phosphopantothenoylcysteine decarboxylase/phosphopantothenate--cysteine ligase CoaBC [Chloroflexota bacterium]|nr:bifunctional phosphopantothenoylcysteine decarboxylase/phosphopantothenate--cysteine ligase CoaBC [Chloroflexota bacterium]MDE2884897.1 bifunctional phosphopantothenoylcysteine decarboxylase/phosphopantothenate--cysteine ligase CoaBC [Chloroflexota bacterium]